MSIETISYDGHVIECRKTTLSGLWWFQPPLDLSGRIEDWEIAHWSRMADRKAAARGRAVDVCRALTIVGGGDEETSYRRARAHEVSGLGLFLALLALVPA